MGYDFRDERDRRRPVPGRGTAGDMPMAPGRTTLGHRLPFGPPRATEAKREPGSEPEREPDPMEQVADSSSTGLPDDLKGELEGALGTDLGDVRVHTDAAAEAAAAALDAQAFAVGTDVYFGAGHYDPGSTAGKALIAHEVAHTVQQRGASPLVQGRLEVSTPGDAHEVEADRFADSFIAGKSSPVTPVSVGSVQRRVIARQVAGPAPAAPAPAPPAPAPAPEQPADVHELERAFGDAKDTVNGLMMRRRDAVITLEQNLREADPPSVGAELLQTLALGALGGATGGLSMLITNRLVKETAKVLFAAVQTAIEDGMKAAADRVARQLTSNGPSMGSFFGAQRDSFTDLTLATQLGINARKATEMRAATAASGEQQAAVIRTQLEGVNHFNTTLTGMYEVANATQYQHSLRSWLSVLSRRALGTRTTPDGRQGTDIGDAARASLWATNHAEGVIYVFCGFQSQSRPFEPRMGIRLHGVTNSVLENDAIKATPIKDLGIPIVVGAVMKRLPSGSTSALRFGRNETNTVWVDGSSSARSVLMEAAGTNDVAAAARVILEQDIGRLTLATATT